MKEFLIGWAVLAGLATFMLLPLAGLVGDTAEDLRRIRSLWLGLVLFPVYAVIVFVRGAMKMVGFQARWLQ